jgi:hypothetical protein
MENNSGYDGYITQIRFLNRISLFMCGLIVLVTSILLWKISFHLEINILITLVSVSLIGLTSVLRNKEKSKVMYRFAETFEIDLENDLDEFNNTIALYKKGEFEKIEAAFTNKKHTRNRGFDQKGFTGGKQTASLDKKNERIDAMKNTDYDDIVEEITHGETLIREADKIYAEVSEKRWNKSESEDKDLIEAGVGRLGDLIKTDWFEKNAKDGAIRELYSDDD